MKITASVTDFCCIINWYAVFFCELSVLQSNACNRIIFEASFNCVNVCMFVFYFKKCMTCGLSVFAFYILFVFCFDNVFRFSVD